MVLVNYVDSDSEYDSEDENFPRLVSDGVDVAKTTSKVLTCHLRPCKHLTFNSHAQLRAHKAANKNIHDYCATCDEDFDDYDQLTLHLLNSDKHMTCCVCLKEFKSEGGLDLHMKQSHRQRSEASCPGCGERFATASGLLQHVEGNLCMGGLRRSDLHKRVLESQEALSNLQLNVKAAVEKAEKKAAIKKHEEEEEEEDFKDVKEDDDERSVASQKPGPKVRLVDVRDKPEEIQDQGIEILDEWFDPVKRQWVCPFKLCKKRYAQLLSFEQHVNSPTHQAKNFRCPGCLNRFASSSALLQHVEAGQCRLGTVKGNQGMQQAVQEELIAVEQRGKQKIK